MEWLLIQGVSMPRKPTAQETITTLLLLLPFLSSLLYRLYAKIKRRDGRSVGLHILTDPTNDDHVKYEIIAVHGLGANPEHTWTCKSNLKSKTGDAQLRVHLLKDLLMKDERFSDARILRFAYNSDWLVDACFESARDIGLRLIESLAEHRKHHPRLPLVFVGHSFGGIVIKEALSSDPNDSQKILEDTCGIIFLGTPHLGSPIAGFGATVAYLTGFLGSNTGLLLLLRSNGEMLVNLSIAFQECLERKYRELDKRTKIISICEQKPTYLLNWLYAGMIVPLQSATFGTNFMDVSKVDKDHSGLNKCHNTHDPLYKELTAQLNRIRPNTPPKINTLQQAVIDRLKPPITVPDAEFHPGLDEYGRGSLECLPQTREEILKDICDWLDDSVSSQKRLYWLQGKAGTGKTTIARTVVSHMAEKNRIIANFFFKRGEGDRAKLGRFFITLAAQLVRKSPSFAKAVQDALESDPSLPEQDPKVQFKKLIQEPMQQQKFDKSKAIIVVVDALDECDSSEDLATQLRLLLIKYFLTSRLDHHTQPISKTAEEKFCDKVELEDATSGTVKRDIELYFRFHLREINGLLDPTPAGDPWSSSSNLKILRDLTERACPLFEFAAAACRFIAQTGIPGTPRELLSDILGSQTSGNLNKVYESIVMRRFYNLEGQYHKKAKAQFQKVIGSVVSLADSVDVNCLAQLTDLPTQAIYQELHLFESVLVVPTERDNQSPVRLFHESFRDFLTGPDTNAEFKVDSISAHRLLASRCCCQLLCESLEENICQLESPGTHRSEVSDETIKNFLPLQLQYACRFWVYHVKGSESKIQDGDEWHSFLLLLGRISESASLVTELKMIFSGVKVKTFLEDAGRLILSFRHIIDAAPLQLYSSVLTFAPKQSVIRETFDECRAGWISHLPNVDSQWSPCLQTLEGHTMEVSCVAFSSDGLLASGGIHAEVKIWDPLSGICLKAFSLTETRVATIYSLAFLQNGKLVCQTAKSMYVWDIRQDICVQRLDSAIFTTDTHKLMVAELKDGYEERLYASFGCKPIILASDGQLIFNTNPKANSPPKILEKTSRYREDIWMAHFSLDNRYFASREDHIVVKIWEISSAICLQVIEESEQIEALVFSPDDQLPGMGYYYGNIVIWDWKNRTRLKTFIGHQAWLASASADHTVKIWDTLTCTMEGESMTEFKIGSIRMAMDGRRIITLPSDGGRPQLWDNFGGKIIEYPFTEEYYEVTISANGGIMADSSYPPHTHTRTHSIALSANGERFISAFGAQNGGIIEVKETRTGHLLKAQHYELSPYRFTCVAISSDGGQVAWRGGRPDVRAKIYTDNVCTDALRELQFHKHAFWPESLGFSQNGKRLAAVGWRWKGAVWDVETGVYLRAWEPENRPNWLQYRENLSFINFDFTEIAGSPVLERWEDCLARYCIGIDGMWVMRDGKRLLWIPPEYRPADVAVSGSMIAFGRARGRPFVIGFSDTDLC
ncbi:hypothetical protein ACQKWADRAFT_331432 [Trichoderma austrokoningii]